MPPAPAVPTATYRLQLQPDFPFHAATTAVPHLAALGVSHLHLSPSWRPSPAPSTATTSSTPRAYARNSAARRACANCPAPPATTASA